MFECFVGTSDNIMTVIRRPGNVFRVYLQLPLNLLCLTRPLTVRMKSQKNDGRDRAGNHNANAGVWRLDSKQEGILLVTGEKGLMELIRAVNNPLSR
jgi:hypothetical protein